MVSYVLFGAEILEEEETHLWRYGNKHSLRGDLRGGIYNEKLVIYIHIKLQLQISLLQR